MRLNAILPELTKCKNVDLHGMEHCTNIRISTAAVATNQGWGICGPLDHLMWPASEFR